MNRLLKAGLVSLVLATQSLANPEAPINDNHRDWSVILQATKKAKEEDPSRINFFEEKLLEKRVEYKENPKRKRNWNVYTKVGWEDIIEIFQGNRYAAIKIVPDMIKSIQYQGIEMDPQGRKHFIENEVRKISKNQKIREKSKEYFGYEKVDCVLMSSMALAFNLAMQEQARAELVSGIYFDKTHSPNGTAHQWMQIGDFIIDPAIELQTENYKYIPIVSTVFIKKDGRIETSQRPNIHIFSQDMHREYMKLNKK